MNNPFYQAIRIEIDQMYKNLAKQLEFDLYGLGVTIKKWYGSDTRFTVTDNRTNTLLIHWKK